MRHTFAFIGDDDYAEVDPHEAIRAVFANWEVCEPTRGEQAALRAALRRTLAAPE